MKNIMGQEMHEQKERTKALETKIDRLNVKFVIYVEAIHHCRFITRDAPQYTGIMKKLMTKVHSAVEGSPSIKEEAARASTNHPNTTAQQEGNS